MIVYKECRTRCNAQPTRRAGVENLSGANAPAWRRRGAQRGLAQSAFPHEVRPHAQPRMRRPSERTPSFWGLDFAFQHRTETSRPAFLARRRTHAGGCRWPTASNAAPGTAHDRDVHVRAHAHAHAHRACSHAGHAAAYDALSSHRLRRPPADKVLDTKDTSMRWVCGELVLSCGLATQQEPVRTGEGHHG